MDAYLRYQQARKVTLIGGLCNVVLGVLKIVFGIVGHSQALFADGINSSSDVFVDLLILFVSRTGSQAPDSGHPYGHGRVETVFTVVLSVILIVVAAGLIYDAIDKSFLTLQFLEPNVWTLLIAVLSIVLNELMFHYNLRIGRRINSNILKANAWHRRSDMFSSLVVLLGIGGSLLGIRYLDGIAAIIVALIIFKMGIQMAWASIQELMDASVGAEQTEQFRATIRQVPGVKSVHQLRTRLLGGLIFIDVHVQVDSRISVSEGHFIAEQVQKTLLSRFPSVSDVMAHIDSEDDELVMISVLAPDRSKLWCDLEKCCCDLPGFVDIKRIHLHYLDGKVEVEIYLPLSFSDRALEAQYQQRAKQISNISKVNLYYGL